MKKQNKTSVEWDAAAYDQLSDPQFGWGKALLATVELRGDETVLDAGCGSGRLTEELLGRLPHGRVLALDLSSNMLEVARERLKHSGDRVQFFRNDLANFVLPEPVDGIFSNAVFHWVPDHDSLFRSLFKALKPGAWLVAQFGGEGNLRRLKARALEIRKMEPFASLMQEFVDATNYAGEEVTQQKARAAGFVDVKTARVPAPVQFPSAEAMRNFVSKVNLHRYLAALPDELANDFASRVVEMAAKDDPPYTLDYLRLTIRARRPA